MQYRVKDPLFNPLDSILKISDFKVILNILNMEWTTSKPLSSARNTARVRMEFNIMVESFWKVRGGHF